MEDVTQVIIIILFVLLIVFSILQFIFYHQRRQRSHILEKEKLESGFTQTLLEAQLEIQEHTLKNVSQEIHDNIGQVLSLAKLNLNLIEPADQEKSNGKVGIALRQVTKAINDLRDLSRSLNPDSIMAQGLINAIAFELELIQKSGTHQTEFRISGKSVTIEPQKELLLFRIVQEALHNMLKHAEATVVEVTADYSPRLLQLNVYDNGRGFDLNKLNETGNSSFGLGIHNMHNRAKMIGADFSMSSTLGKGTVLKVSLPLANGQ